ncbi:sugar ABC transporter permease [Spirochaetia bacterium]|nr:sugar ABC transporter permease [Spirochaetia bacterium]
MNYKKSESIGLLYILPWFIGFLSLQLIPLINSFWYSFTNFQLIGNFNFVGLENFKTLFTDDPVFWQSLKVTFYYVFIAVPGKLAFALFIAVVLNQKRQGINLFRTIYYLPSIFGGSIAISALWKFLFMKRGVVNQIFGIIHIPAQDWLGSPKWALFTISLVNIWEFGSSMVLFLAGLKQIPETLYEAARIDGAGRIKIFFRVTLPLLTPILFFNLIMQMINAFQQFTNAFVITNGGPLKATYLYGMMLYEQGFRFFKMGYASALSWVLFIIIFAFTSLSFGSSSSWVHYGDKI